MSDVWFTCKPCHLHMGSRCFYDGEKPLDDPRIRGRFPPMCPTPGCGRKMERET